MSDLVVVFTDVFSALAPGLRKGEGAPNLLGGMIAGERWIRRTALSHDWSTHQGQFGSDCSRGLRSAP